MSDSKVSFTAAVYHQGYIYAIGSAIYEEKDRFFRATLIDVPDSPDDVSPEPPDIPKTADDNSLLLWILLIAAALGTALGGGLLYHHRKGS